MTGARAGDRPKAGRLDLPLDAHLHTDLSPDADVPVNVHAALPARVIAFAAGRPLGEIVRPYFDEVLSAVRSGLFDALGHLDMVKRWLVPHIDPSTFAAAPELYEPVLAALVDPGMAMEVNSSGLRQAAHTSRTRRRGPSGASASSGGVA